VGAPVTAAFADAYAPDAVSAVHRILRMDVARSLAGAQYAD